MSKRRMIMFEPADEPIAKNQALQSSAAAKPDTAKSGGLATAAFIIGVIACSMNILLFTAPVGVIFSLIAFILGLIAFIQQNQLSGLVLSLISFLIFMIWAASLV